MRTSMLTAVAFIVAGCSSSATLPRASSADPIAGRVPGPPRTCISTSAAENLHVLDPHTVAYGYGETVWVSHVQADCPPLSHFNTLIVEASTGKQYCHGDRIRASETGAIIPGPSCNLSDWVPYRHP